MAAEIRRLRETDIETLIDGCWFSFNREMAALDPYNELAADVREDAITYRHERLADDGVATFVAERSERLVGYASVEYRESPPVFRRGPEANVGECYVRPAHRKDRVASRLLERAEEWGREQGCERVTLSVNAANEPARRLYESRGYETRRHKMDKPL